MSLWFEHNRIPLGGPAAEAGRLPEGKAGELGLDWLNYVMIRPPRACRIDLYSTVITCYPRRWVERYIEQDYAPVDPVVERSSREMRPFAWTAGSSSPAPRRKRMEAESRDFGIAHGVTLPLRDRHGAVGMFTGAARSEKRVRDAARRLGEGLFAAACDIHEFAVDRVLGERAGDIGDAGLTPREREVLLWTLEGKTAKDIAAILGLSANTVNRHAYNAAQKLGSLNKHHAAVQAYRAGLI